VSVFPKVACDENCHQPVNASPFPLTCFLILPVMCVDRLPMQKSGTVRSTQASGITTDTANQYPLAKLMDYNRMTCFMIGRIWVFGKRGHCPSLGSGQSLCLIVDATPIPPRG
jgi:hypothetical protein